MTRHDTILLIKLKTSLRFSFLSPETFEKALCYISSSPPFNPTYIGSLSVYTGTTRIPLVVFTCRTSERGSLLSFRNDGRFPLSLYGHIISFASDKNVAYRMTFFFILIFWKQCLIDIYIGSCVWKQRCGWINPAAHRTTTHTHTHTHTEKGSKVSSSSSLFHPLACVSSSLRFVCFFLLATWSCVFFLFFAVPFFVFDLRLLLASGTAIFLAEAHREGKVSRREGKSIRLMLSGWSIGASIRLPTNILESNGSAPDLSHWIFFPGFSLTLYIYQLDLP